MSTKRYTVTLSVEVELDTEYGPTLNDMEGYLADRVGAFLYAPGMNVLSAQTLTSVEKEVCQ